MKSFTEYVKTRELNEASPEEIAAWQAARKKAALQRVSQNTSVSDNTPMPNLK